MRIYYMDEPLNKEEWQSIKNFLAERDGVNSIKAVEQIRVPMVLPIPGTNGKFKEDITERINLIKNNLLKAGLRRDQGSQIVWVLPRDLDWGSIFQMAIYEITGFFPYIVQRWFYLDEQIIRRDIRLIDGHGMMGYKEKGET